MNLRHVTYDCIDKKKWDRCIEDSRNAMIYAESIYLDQMCKQWDAIVLDDYTAVMPLPWRKKMGIKYLYQPAFHQQGGIYSTKPLSGEMVRAFLDMASSIFKFAEITLNHDNEINELKDDFLLKQRNNFIVNLHHPYSSKDFDSYLTKRIRRSEKWDLQYTKSSDFQNIIKLYKKYYGKKIGGFSNDDYQCFESLCMTLSKKKRVLTRLVYDREGKELLAAVILLKSKERYYNMVSVITDNGKKKLANYFLYDRIIREFSDSDMLLDMEGSDVKGIAYFYEKFSSANQKYSFVKWNRLPKIVKLLKS